MKKERKREEGSTVGGKREGGRRWGKCAEWWTQLQYVSGREAGWRGSACSFHKTLKGILMRILPLHVSMLQLKNKNTAVDPLRGSLEREREGGRLPEENN